MWGGEDLISYREAGNKTGMTLTVGFPEIDSISRNQASPEHTKQVVPTLLGETGGTEGSEQSLIIYILGEGFPQPLTKGFAAAASGKSYYYYYYFGNLIFNSLLSFTEEGNSLESFFTGCLQTTNSRFLLWFILIRSRLIP